MLCHEDRRVEFGRDPAKHQIERVNAPGRCADRQNLRANGVQGRFWRRVRATCTPAVAGRTAERLDLAEQLRAIVFVKAAGARLEHGICRPHRKCGHRGLCPVIGKR